MKINKKTKNKLIFIFLFLICLIGLYIFASNNYSFYKRTIVKVYDVHIDNTYIKQGTNGENEEYYVQTLKCKIKNGKYKNKTVEIQNEYSYSSVITNEYKKGNELFVNLKNNNNKLKADIQGEKRDTFILLLFMIFVFFIVISAKKRGIYTILSFLINTLLLIISITVFGISGFLNGIWIALMVVFVLLTLIFSLGINKKTLGAIISTSVTILFISCIYLLTVYKNLDLHYESMDYVIAFLPLKKIYFISIIMGCLGAIMDVTVTINSGVCELVSVCSNTLTLKDLIRSVRELSRDIMGTMMNVLFFSYVSGAVPMVVLKIQNNIGINIILKNDLGFELIRFIIGSIGIVSAIPISAFVAILLFNKGLKKSK